MPSYDAKKKKKTQKQGKREKTKPKIPANLLQPQHLVGSPGDSQAECQSELHTHSLFHKGKDWSAVAAAHTHNCSTGEAEAG